MLYSYRNVLGKKVACLKKETQQARHPHVTCETSLSLNHAIQSDRLYLPTIVYI
jgi:hypothetical protein